MPLPERPLRVLHVIPSVRPQEGGPSTLIRGLCRELVSWGIQVDIATTFSSRLEGSGKDKRPIVEDQVRYWNFSKQTNFYSFSWPLSRWLLQNLDTYDLLHVHAIFSYPSNIAALLAKRKNIPYIIRPLGTLNRWGLDNQHRRLKKLSLRFVEGRLIRNAAWLHFTSEQERLEALRVGIAPPSRIIPNGIDLSLSRQASAGDFLQHHPELREKRWLLYLSRFHPKKGLNLLFRALALLRRDNIRPLVALAGSGEHRFVQTLQQEATRLGIQDQLVWLGFLKGTQKWGALASASAFVLPSYSENFGISVVEAMACGLPVVITDQVAIHKEVSRAAAGLVVPCQAAPLAQALEKILQGGSKAELGARAQGLAHKQFSIEKTIQSLVTAYAQTLGTSPEANAKKLLAPKQTPNFSHRMGALTENRPTLP